MVGSICFKKLNYCRAEGLQMTLSPSQRILLIKNIATRLGSEGWPNIDLTLKQFSLPFSDAWNGDQEPYIMKMIERASDQSLLDLGQHVGFKLEDLNMSRNEPDFWHEGMFRLFVSHIATHREFASDLKNALSEYGIFCFVAHNDIEPTKEWQTQIETALVTCDALVALLHEGFHASNWTDQEIGYAMGRGVPVFSVRFEQIPYGFIGRFQAFNGNGKTAISIARELFNAYRRNQDTQRRMGEILIKLFEESSTFNEAKTRIGYLEESEFWEPTFSSRLIEALKNNSQISGSWGVPNRVDLLIQKWNK